MNLITVDELASMLQVPKSWIYDRTRDGRIPCIKVGKYIRFDLNEVKSWLEKQQPNYVDIVE